MMQHSLRAASILLMAITVALIGASRAAAQAIDLPFTGVVVHQDAELRSRPGPDSYPVGRIRVGSQVQVLDIVAGWYRVTPPVGVFSYIAKDAIEVAPDGETGLIIRDTAQTLAAHRSGPAQSDQPQVQLSRGQQVRIVGDEGDFYRILPPSGAAVYLPPGGLRRSQVPAVAGPALTVPAATEQPVVEAAEAPAATAAPGTVTAATVATAPLVATVVERATVAADGVTAPAAPAATPEPVVADTGPSAAETLLEPVSASLAAVEQELAAAGRLPLEQQPLEALLQTYEGLYEGGHLVRHDQRIVRGRIAQLRYRLKVARALAELKVTTAEAASAGAAVAAEAKPDPRPQFVQSGRLTVSGIYSGRDMPLLYRLVDPRTGRTVAYITPGESFDAAAMLGQLVTVEGDLVLDPAVQARTVQVRSMKLQASAAQAASAG